MELETQLPATLNERQENVVQMQKIQRLTVEPGVMKLPVKQVTSAANSDNWQLLLEHPIEGDLQFFVSKPNEGWHEDQEFVKLLHWYGIFDNNPYKLQEHYLYVEKTSESDRNHGWALLNPNYREERAPTARESTIERIRDLRSKLPERKQSGVYAAHLLIPPIFPAAIIGAEMTANEGVLMYLITIMIFFSVTVIIIMMTEPPE